VDAGNNRLLAINENHGFLVWPVGGIFDLRTYVVNETVLAGGTNPLVTSHVAALVSAVNGIEERYQPIHVTPKRRGMLQNVRRRFRQPMPCCSSSIPRSQIRSRCVTMPRLRRSQERSRNP